MTPGSADFRLDALAVATDREKSEIHTPARLYQLRSQMLISELLEKLSSAIDRILPRTMKPSRRQTAMQMPCRSPCATSVLKRCSGGSPILVATASAARSFGSTSYSSSSYLIPI